MPEQPDQSMSAKKIVVRKRRRRDDDEPSEDERTSQKYYGGRKIRLVRKPEDELDELDELDEQQAERQRLAEQMAELREEEEEEEYLPVAQLAQPEPEPEAIPVADAAYQRFDRGTAYEEPDPEYQVAPPRHRPATIRIDIPLEGPHDIPPGGGRDMPEDMDLRKALSDSCRIPDAATEEKLRESQQIILGEPEQEKPVYEREPLFLRHDELGICYVYTFAEDSGSPTINLAFETIGKIGLEQPKCFLMPNHIETRNPHLACVNPFLSMEELGTELGYFLMDHKIWRYSEYVMPAGPAIRYFWKCLDENGRKNLQSVFDKILRATGSSQEAYEMAGVHPVEFIGVTNPFRCQYF